MANSRDNTFDADKRNSLVEAVREVKIAAAERSDVVIDMKEADRARLEILAKELQPVFDEVPLDDERFDFSISSGLQPRLWIDATAHVIMGKDRRQYRFIRDTRVGRIVLCEATQTEPVCQVVTKYIAERIHERELALAEDDLVFRPTINQRHKKMDAFINDYYDDLDADEKEQGKTPGSSQPKQSSQSKKAARPDALSQAAKNDTIMGTKDQASKTGTSPIGWLLLGLFVGGGALLLAYREQIFGVVI